MADYNDYIDRRYIKKEEIFKDIGYSDSQSQYQSYKKEIEEEKSMNQNVDLTSKNFPYVVNISESNNRKNDDLNRSNLHTSVNLPQIKYLNSII